MGSGGSTFRPLTPHTHNLEGGVSDRVSAVPLSSFILEDDEILNTCEQLTESYESFGEPTVLVMNKLLHRFGQLGAQLAIAQNDYLSKTKDLYNQVLSDEELIDADTSALFLTEALCLYDLHGKELSNKSTIRIVRGMMSFLKKRKLLNWSQLELVLRAVSWTLIFHPERFV